MRFFVHVSTDSKRISDLEGKDYASLEPARVEAIEAAREIVRLRLQEGKNITPAWCIEITDIRGNIVEQFGFGTIVFGESRKNRPEGHVYRFRPRASR